MDRPVPTGDRLLGLLCKLVEDEDAAWQFDWDAGTQYCWHCDGLIDGRAEPRASDHHPECPFGVARVICGFDSFMDYQLPAHREEDGPWPTSPTP